MLNVSRLLSGTPSSGTPWSGNLLVKNLLLLCLLSCAASVARAQAAPETTLHRNFTRLELGVTAIGTLTKDVAGTNYLNIPVSQKASTTVGVQVILRYTKSPWIGFEGNYTQARFTENFGNYLIGGVQTKANEYSLGYVVHPRQVFGLDPFVALGVGTTAFTPTAGGGQGLSEQARMTYYYNVGVDKLLTKHFGARISARQTFYKAPDFGQNYITINKQTNTFEPSIGFYLKY
jgi:hypothetical protein